MATLQLPATNLANLANLPPGTKLYLTTNSKNPSGKGKLLLIPQGAILRAANPAGKMPKQTVSLLGCLYQISEQSYITHLKVHLAFYAEAPDKHVILWDGFFCSLKLQRVYS